MTDFLKYFINDEIDTGTPIILQSDVKIILDILVKVYEEMKKNAQTKDDNFFKTLKDLSYDYRHRRVEMKFRKLTDNDKHLYIHSNAFTDNFKAIFCNILSYDIEENPEKYLSLVDKITLYERYDMMLANLGFPYNELTDFGKTNLRGDIVYNVFYQIGWYKSYL